MIKDVETHSGCPNRRHCEKDEEKCCYLVKKKCFLESDESEVFI